MESLKSRKAQAAVMDAFIFMAICAGAATLLLHVSKMYGASTSVQVSVLYNYEFTHRAFVSLFYAQDSKNDLFMLQLKEKLAEGDPRTAVETYLRNDAKYNVWDKLKAAAPTDNVSLCFDCVGYVTKYFCCHGDDPICDDRAEPVERTAFTYAIQIKDINGYEWEISLKLYY